MKILRECIFKDFNKTSFADPHPIDAVNPVTDPTFPFSADPDPDPCPTTNIFPYLDPPRIQNDPQSQWLSPFHFDAYPGLAF